MALYNTKDRQEFEEKVLKSDKLVLVDFWAEWCQPCRAMAPILESFADKNDDKVDIVKVNVEETNENGLIATENAVQSIPNMVVFKDGKEVDRIIGLTREPELTERLLKLA